MMDERVSVSEAAEMLGLSRQAIHNRIKSGKYPAEKVIDGVQEYYEIPREVVEEELSTRDVKASSVRQPLKHQLLKHQLEGEAELTSHQPVDELVMAIRNVSQINQSTVKALEDELRRKDLIIERLQEGLIQLAEKRVERRSWLRRFFGL